MAKYIKDEKLKLAVERQKECAKGQGVKKGKQIGFKKSIKLSSIIATLTVIGSIGAYMSFIAIQSKNIDLTNEIKTTDLAKITIPKEAKEIVANGVNENKILLTLFNKNQTTIKNLKNYKIDVIKYDKDTGKGEAKVLSTNWMAKQEVNIKYEVEKATT